ncbi:hypothetical protein BH24ACT5_BH24ACT5_19420 [soil metagenome]
MTTTAGPTRRRSRPLVLGVGAVVAAGVSIVTMAARPQPGAALDGATLFGVKGCATCHIGPNGRASFVGVAPSLADAGDWAGQRIDGLSAAEYLAQSMREPSAFISPDYRGSSGPGTGMPVLQLSVDEIDAIVDYLLDDRIPTG